MERRKAEEDTSEKEADTIEEGRIQDNLDWAEKEEHKELEELKQQEADEAQRKAEEQMEIERQVSSIGEGFGEDIDTDFGDV